MNKNYNPLIDLGDNVYEESPGLYYQDFEVGTTYKHWPGRTIIDADNIYGSLLTCNQHPLHVNEQYGNKTEFGKNPLNSVITFAIVNGMTVSILSAKCIANLGWEKVRLVNPVFVGDTLYSVSKILDKRLSESRPEQGIITVETKGFKQENIEVITFQRSFLVPFK